MRILFLFTFLIFFQSEVLSQVRNVTAAAKEHKGNRGSGSSTGSSSYSDDDDAGLFTNLFIEILEIPFRGMWMAHERQLSFAQDDNWRISFEAQASGGFDIDRTTILLNPSIRGNWGLFSSQLRYTKITDQSADFSTLDWQVFQMNLINSEHARWLVGLGFSHELLINQTHPELVTELSFFIADRQWEPGVSYRSSGGGLPRTEYASSLAYHYQSQGKVHPKISLGYTHQNWYGEKFNFLTLSVGLVLQ